MFIKYWIFLRYFYLPPLKSDADDEEYAEEEKTIRFRPFGGTCESCVIYHFRAQNLISKNIFVKYILALSENLFQYQYIACYLYV